MKPTLSVALSALTIGVAMAAHAQTATQSPTPGAADPTFSAYALAQQCSNKSDNAAQGQCVGAVRGIVRGYQYGVLFLSQRASLPEGETRCA